MVECAAVVLDVLECGAERGVYRTTEASGGIQLQRRRRGLLAPGVNDNGGVSEKIMQIRKGWREDMRRLASGR